MAAAKMRVFDYATGAELEGKPTQELIDASFGDLASTDDTGVVSAYFKKGEWHFAPEDKKADLRAIGYDVQKVWVDE